MEAQSNPDCIAREGSAQSHSQHQQTLSASGYLQQLVYHLPAHISQGHGQQQGQQRHTFVDVNSVPSNQGNGLTSGKSLQQGYHPFVPSLVATAGQSSQLSTTQFSHQTLGPSSVNQQPPVYQPTSGFLQQEITRNIHVGSSTGQMSTAWQSHGSSGENQMQIAFDCAGQQATGQSNVGTSCNPQQTSSKMHASAASESIGQIKAAGEGSTVLILSSGVVDDITKHLGRDKQSDGSVVGPVAETARRPEPLTLSIKPGLTAHQQECQDMTSRQPERTLADELPQSVHMESSRDGVGNSGIAQTEDIRKGPGTAMTSSRTIDGPEAWTAIQGRMSNGQPAKKQKEKLTKEREEEFSSHESSQEDDEGWVEDDWEEAGEEEEEEQEEQEEEEEEEDGEDSDNGDDDDSQTLMDLDDDDDEDDEDLDVPPLPEGFWYKFSSSSGKEERTIVGVIAEEQIPAAKQFGPLKGKLVGEEEGCPSSLSWELCTKGNVLLYIEAADSDWMSHIQCAQRKTDQNMEAVQLYGDIYFRTTKVVEPGSELKVFYSEEYSEHAGFETNLEELQYHSDLQAFSCCRCQIQFTNPKLMLRHMKVSHYDISWNEPRPVVTWKTPSQMSNSKQSLEQALRQKSKLFLTRNNSTELVSNQGPDQRKRYSDNMQPSVSQKTQHHIKENKESREKPVGEVGKKLEQSHRPVHSEGDPGQKLSTVAGKELVTELGENLQQGLRPVESKDGPIVKFHKLDRGIDSVTMLSKDPQQRHRPVESKVNPRSKLPHEEAQKDHLCVTCGKLFPTEGRLLAHKLFHTDSSENKCPICGEIQRSSYVLEKHIKGHGTRSYQCQHCPKKYHTQHGLYCHQLRLHSNKKDYYQCSRCPVKYQFYWQMKLHKKEHANEKNRAKDGGMKSGGDDVMEEPVNPKRRNARKPKMKKPKEVVEIVDVLADEDNSVKDMLGKKLDYFKDPTLKFKCKYCPKRYSSEFRARMHQREVHEGRGRYKCPHCPKQFSDYSRFDIHQQKHNTTDKPFKCTECPRSFASDSALKSHSGEHTGLKPFKCDLCGRGFKKKGLIREHIKRIHSVVELNYPCSLCNKRFPAKWNLEKHMRRHEGLRPFKCDICGKGFTAKHSLQVHIRGVHEKLKPYECEICGKKSSTVYHHNSHVLTHKRKGMKKAQDKQIEEENQVSFNEQELN